MTRHEPEPGATARRADRRICVLLNEGSGSVGRAAEQIAEVARLIGPHGEIRRISLGRGIEDAAREALADGFDTLVPAGGDGTIMTVAGVAARRGATLGLLPLGTFNFFARGLGIPEDPVAAARILLDGEERDWALGEVNGRLFLNNASLGVYPMILREREAVYRRFGRRRIAAHWSVVRAFLKAGKSMRLKLRFGDGDVPVRTPLLFVARSSYQLRHFDLDGADCVDEDRFAIFAAPDGTRWDLFRHAWRLARKSMVPGEDFRLICCEAFTVESSQRRLLVACDGEKFRMQTPLHFRMLPEALRVIGPRATA